MLREDNALGGGSPWVSDCATFYFWPSSWGEPGSWARGCCGPRGRQRPIQRFRRQLGLTSSRSFHKLMRSFHRRWTEQKLVPALPAPELAVMRRLSLVLCGSVPSLEEIRRFEARPSEGRIEAWLDDLLARPPLRRLPGRAIRSCLCRHRGRAIPAVSPPPVHRLAERCAPGKPPVRRTRPAT